MKLLELENVSFNYAGQSPHVLQGINWSISTGQCHCVTGATGSGKSSLLHLFAGILPRPHEGELTRADNLTIGLVMQDPQAQLLRQTVGAEVAFALENLGIPSDDMLLRVQQALRRVGLFMRLDTPVQTLSLGQKYRLMIAAQWVCEPDLLLLDEPWAQLDEKGVQELRGVLRHLMGDGMALVLVEHNANAFADIITDYWRLEAGLLIQGQHNTDSDASNINDLEVATLSFEHEVIANHSLESHSLESSHLEEHHLKRQGAAERIAERFNSAKPTSSRAEAQCDTCESLDVTPWAQFTAQTGTHTHAQTKKPPVDTQSQTQAHANEGALIIDVAPFALHFPKSPVLFRCPQGFRVREGELMTLVGVNGTGKTSLLKALAGMLDLQQSLPIKVLGKSPKLGVYGSQLGLLMQRPSRQLFESTVLAEMQFSLTRFDLPVTRASDLLAAIGLSSLASQSPHKLSYGQQHVIALASLVCMRPAVLLLDDPLAGMDKRYYVKVWQMLQLCLSQGCAILLTSHRPIFHPLVTRQLTLSGKELRLEQDSQGDEVSVSVDTNDSVKTDVVHPVTASRALKFFKMKLDNGRGN